MADSQDAVPEVPLALVSNQYYETKIAQMRNRPVPWEGYQRANLITSEQLDLIQRIDNKSPQVIKELADERGDTYANLYLQILDTLNRPDTIQHVLLLIEDFLTDHEENVQYFHHASGNKPTYPYGPLFKHLRVNDDIVPLQASKILTIFASSAPSPSMVDLSPYFNWIATQVQSEDLRIVDLAVQELESILRVREYRLPFWETPKAAESLIHVLRRTSPGPQMQYQVIFCIWLLTFDAQIASTINRQYDIIPLLIDIAKSALKEKVIRVVIASFRNLVEKQPESNLAAMLVAKLLPFTENLSTRKWSDNDIVEDIDYLKAELEENFHSLSTFEEYSSEVETGKLTWSPPHKSEVFWKENAQRLNEQDYRLLRILARLLSTSQSPLVLSVAAHDIGQYVKYSNKDAKKIVQEIGAKQRIMELMTHEDQDVRYQALSAVQKYMTNAWEF
ncbi:armadillo-type protein [Umbelopsis sp. AD052]|nr:armadillo-type protein [Umbelopsis sp. AD052]